MELGGTDLEPSKSLGKGKTLPEPAWMEPQCGRPHVVHFTVALQRVVQTRAGDLEPLYILRKRRKWL